MKRIVFLASFLFVSLSLILNGCVQESGIPDPQDDGYVHDFAGMISDTEEKSLEEKLSSLETATSNEIAVVTVKSLGGKDIETYSIELARKWGIGQKEKDNGILLLIAKEERKMRIEVGYGLEGALPDGLAGTIVRNEITPSFKQEKYFEGINRGVDSIIAATQGEYTPSAPPADTNPPQSEQALAIIIIIVIVLIGGLVLFAVFASLSGGGYGGNDGFFGSSWSSDGSSGGSSGGFGGGSFGGGGASGGW